MKRFFWITLALLPFLSCTRQSAGGTSAGIPFEDTRWKLTSLTGITQLPAADKDMFTRFYKKRAYAYAGCNNLVGSYTLQGNTLKVMNLASTKMACPQPFMDAETQLTEALHHSTGFKIVGNKMLLMKGATVVAEFEASSAK